MAEGEPLRKIVEDLIEVMHLQAQELERLVVQVEQRAGRIPQENRLSVIVSELADLQRRIRGLGTAP